MERHHGPLSSFWDVDTKHLSFEGILSTSLISCKNTLNQARPTSLSSFDSLEYSLEKKCVTTSIRLGDIWNGVLTIGAYSYIRDRTSCINLQQYRLPWNLKGRSCECVKQGHGFACGRTKVCGDSVQWDNSGCLSRLEGCLNFCSWIQNLDVMEIIQKDYDNCVSSTNHSKWWCLEGMEEMYNDTSISFLMVALIYWWTVTNMVDFITCSNVDILVTWELSVFRTDQQIQCHIRELLYPYSHTENHQTSNTLSEN